jgi:hypothetical protein
VGLACIYHLSPLLSIALVNQEPLSSLFDKLATKTRHLYPDAHRVGPGWLKYEYNNTIWSLDDGARNLPDSKNSLNGRHFDDRL